MGSGVCGTEAGSSVVGAQPEDIEARTGIDRSTLAKLETGQRANFTFDIVRKYAQAVGKRALVTIADVTS